MFNKLHDLSFDVARHNFLKELDTAGPIGSLWIERNHTIVPFMFSIMEFIDTYNKMDDLPNQMVYMPLLDEDCFNAIIDWNLNLPTVILLNSEYDWGLFVSAEITFIDFACQLTLKMLGKLKNPDTQQEICALESKIFNIGNSFEPAIKLLELGASYTDLITAGNFIVRELKAWQQSRPTALQLSESYLNAIGFKTPNCGPIRDHRSNDMPKGMIQDNLETQPQHHSESKSAPLVPHPIGCEKCED